MGWGERIQPTSAATLHSCRYCGATPGHSPERCPQVVGIEYHPDGSIKRVELGSRFAPVTQPAPVPPLVIGTPATQTPWPGVYPPNTCQSVR